MCRELPPADPNDDPEFVKKLTPDEAKKLRSGKMTGGEFNALVQSAMSKKKG